MGFEAQNPASYGGIGIKIGFFLLLTLVSAILFVLLLPNMVNNGSFAVLLAVAAIVALISGFVAAFVPKTIPVAGSIYCIAEGALIGVISALFEAAIQGIVLMALLATVFTLGIICLLYFTGVVKVGSGFLQSIDGFSFGNSSFRSWYFSFCRFSYRPFTLRFTTTSDCSL